MAGPRAHRGGAAANATANATAIANSMNMNMNTMNMNNLGMNTMNMNNLGMNTMNISANIGANINANVNANVNVGGNVIRRQRKPKQVGRFDHQRQCIVAALAAQTSSLVSASSSSAPRPPMSIVVVPRRNRMPKPKTKRRRRQSQCQRQSQGRGFSLSPSSHEQQLGAQLQQQLLQQQTPTSKRRRTEPGAAAGTAFGGNQASLLMLMQQQQQQQATPGSNGQALNDLSATETTRPVYCDMLYPWDRDSALYHAQQQQQENDSACDDDDDDQEDSDGVSVLTGDSQTYTSTTSTRLHHGQYQHQHPFHHAAAALSLRAAVSNNNIANNSHLHSGSNSNLSLGVNVNVNVNTGSPTLSLLGHRNASFQSNLMMQQQQQQQQLLSALRQSSVHPLAQSRLLNTDRLAMAATNIPGIGAAVPGGIAAGIGSGDEARTPMASSITAAAAMLSNSTHNNNNNNNGIGNVNNLSAFMPHTQTHSHSQLQQLLQGQSLGHAVAGGLHPITPAAAAASVVTPSSTALHPHHRSQLHLQATAGFDAAALFGQQQGFAQNRAQLQRSLASSNPIAGLQPQTNRVSATSPSFDQIQQSDLSSLLQLQQQQQLQGHQPAAQPFSDRQALLTSPALFQSPPSTKAIASTVAAAPSSTMGCLDNQHNGLMDRTQLLAAAIKHQQRQTPTPTPMRGAQRKQGDMAAQQESLLTSLQMGGMGASFGSDLLPPQQQQQASCDEQQRQQLLGMHMNGNQSFNNSMNTSMNTLLQSNSTGSFLVSQQQQQQLRQQDTLALLGQLQSSSNHTFNHNALQM